jgi:hypothetical protein
MGDARRRKLALEAGIPWEDDAEISSGDDTLGAQTMVSARGLPVKRRMGFGQCLAILAAASEAAALEPPRHVGRRKGLRPEGLRPECLRPEGLRPEGLRPEGLRPEG